jgi:peptidoglycan/LPS O-acetylase OafA/YrhL
LSQKRLPALDGLRGLAALSVVVYHGMLQSPGFSSGIRAFQPDGRFAWWATLSPLRLLWDGQLAVWMFFILSGYVLSRRYWEGGSMRWGAYYSRRFLRLYLPVVGSAALALLVYSIGQLLSGGELFRLPAGTSLTRLASNLTLVGLTAAPINGVWWSMRWEVWFSILLPPLLLVLPWLGCGPRRRATIMPAVFGVLCAAVVVLQPYIRLTYGTDPLWNQAMLYLPVFGVGIALAAYEPKVRASTRMRGARGWAVLAGAVFLLSWRAPLGALDAVDAIDHRWALCLQHASIVAGMCVVLLLCLSWPAAGTMLSRRSVAWLGTRSYSLYLVHLPIVHAVARVTDVDGSPIWFIAMVLGASIGAAALFFRFIEAPSIRIAQRVGRARPSSPTPDEASDQPDKVLTTV